VEGHVFSFGLVDFYEVIIAPELELLECGVHLIVKSVDIFMGMINCCVICKKNSV